MPQKLILTIFATSLALFGYGHSNDANGNAPNGGHRTH